MMQLNVPDWYDDLADELHAMHRLRYRVFDLRRQMTNRSAAA
ncbi:hypothetical protein [Mesorhizobium sp. M0959]